MIDFPCKCGYLFSVPQDMAGLSVQCPQCGLLQDVPLLSDLESLESDGTFKLDAPPPAEDAHRMAELERAYLPRHTDDNGEDYDLRPTMEDILKAGADSVPLEQKDELRPGAPKYDPVTGELIQPLGIKRDDQKAPRRAGPGKRTLNYAHEIQESNRPRFVPLALFRPGNLVVMFMIFLAHLLLNFTGVIVGTRMLLVGFVSIVVVLMLLSHYGNIVEDIGPGDRDELPAPLRGVNGYDDVLRPLINLMLGLFLSYLPLLLLSAPDKHLVATIPLTILGTLLFPAVFLTLCTSGSIQNLRPDRVIGTIAQCGPSYFLLVLLWVLAAPIYLLGSALTFSFAIMLGAGLGLQGTLLFRPQFSYPILIAGIYLMHLFSWQLGLLYRHHEERFPWILQRHIPTKKILSMAPSAGRDSPPPLPTLPVAAPAPRPPKAGQTAPLPVIPMPVQPIKPKPGPRR